MLDLTDIDRALDDLEEYYRQRAERALRAGAADARSAMRASRAYNDQSGATRAGSTAYVVTPTDDGSGALAEAVDEVEAENAGQSATARGRLAGDVGVVLTVPTAYQEFLERSNTGENAVLAPTLERFADELTARVAQGQ